MRELSDCRVLLVDDVKTNIDLLVEALRADYKLSVALNGAAALRVAAESRPDLILLDVRMPGMDGFEVCRQLRADVKTRDTPIMFLSALDEILDKTRAFEVGGTDYVTKPFEILEVKARVRSLLQAKRYQDDMREQIATELLVARDIQMSIVPKDFRPLGAGGPFELHGVLEPARDVGGDLYQFFPVGEGRICVAVGDVSGKGIPAALFMAITSTLLRATARQLQEPDLILARINDELAAENHSDMFVTLVCALLDGVRSRMVLAKGGHPSPVLLRAGEPPRFVFEAPGTALGICLGLGFERVELPLVPGDSVLFYTDGVTEAFDRGGRCFSEAGLMEHLSGSAAVTSREVVEALLHTVREFSRDVPQSDDIAILAVRFVPGGAAA